jgi:carboxymethylenebutenolidase
MTASQTKAYLAMPASGTGPGVLVLHAWWGLNTFFRSICDRLATAGFIALAPDMFGGQVAHTIEEAEQHQSDWNEAQEVPPFLLSAMLDLSQHAGINGRGLGVIGFSMGGYWALWLAQKQADLIQAVTLFYGTNGGGGDFHQSHAAFLGHFAEKDLYESASTVMALEKNLKAAHRPVTFYTYPGTGHWFFEKDRPEAYHAPASQLAWDRTVQFLKDELG